ncbi:MAG: hypothetical protein ACRDU9_01525 [Acidimicrobiia bacterium]
MIAVLFALVACGSADTGGEVSSTTTPSLTTTIPPTETTGGTVNDQDELTGMAVADLARRLGVGPDEIEVLKVEAVTWPDGSLGCPEPGKIYTQALVDGHRIVLQHDERVYLYHSGQGDEPFLCPSAEKDGGYDFIPPPGDAEK